MPETRLYVKPKRPEQTVESLRLVFQITIIKCCIDARNLSTDEEELEGPDFERRQHLKTEDSLLNVTLGNDKGKLAISYSDSSFLSPEKGNFLAVTPAIETTFFSGQAVRQSVKKLSGK